MFDGNVERLVEVVTGLIASKREGNYWDFKREWHSDKTELLHDIICLANNLNQDESYLVIGVDEGNDYRIVDVTEDENRRSTQNITDWLSHVRWFGSRWPSVEVVPLRLNGNVIDVVVIESAREAMPYCLDKPNGTLGAFKIYLRRNDTNTPINESANQFEVEALWRHRLGLDMAPLDRVPKLLETRDDWEHQSTIYDNGTFYYRFDPRFVIEHEHDDDRDGFEYYMFEQCDTHPSWYTVKISYLGQQIYDCLGVALDGGRYFTVVPERSFFRWWGTNKLDTDICYGYFVKGTLDWALHEFFYEHLYDDEKIAHDRFMRSVLVFKDKAEKADFELFLQVIRTEYEQRVTAMSDPYINMRGRETEHAVAVYGRQLKQALVLKEVFDEYLAGRKNEKRTKTSIDW